MSDSSDSVMTAKQTVAANCSPTCQLLLQGAPHPQYPGPRVVELAANCLQKILKVNSMPAQVTVAAQCM
ncbi:hypothetical protein V1687_28880 (plasmid) [Pseudomonas putida]|nr:hypothetical protein [Pseudomonas putida]WVM70367.1 hypothetical protein V1687_28880 [Pseudomonas putida]